MHDYQYLLSAPNTWKCSDCADSFDSSGMNYLAYRAKINALVCPGPVAATAQTPPAVAPSAQTPPPTRHPNIGHHDFGWIPRPLLPTLVASSYCRDCQAKVSDKDIFAALYDPQTPPLTDCPNAPGIYVPAPNITVKQPPTAPTAAGPAQAAAQTAAPVHSTIPVLWGSGSICVICAANDPQPGSTCPGPPAGTYTATNWSMPPILITDPGITLVPGSSPSPPPAPDDTVCLECGVELSAYLDAYYGTNAYEAACCASCRKDLADAR